VRYTRGQPTHVWELMKGKRNEALDLRVYGMAAISLLRPNFAALAARLSETEPSPMPVRRPLQTIRSNYLGR
jgi:phage terminase large subunit GpA-like protein